MAQLIEFSSNHLVLMIALVVLLLLLSISYFTSSRLSIDPLEATMLINREDAVVVDVRPSADFNKGHIINAINVPLNGFKSQLKMLEKYKHKPIIISCRTGNQSQNACQDLRKAGFEKVFNLRGGIHAWQSNQLPVSRT